VEDGSPNNVSFDATLIVLHEPVDTFKRRTLTAKKNNCKQKRNEGEKKNQTKQKAAWRNQGTSVAIHFRQFKKKTEK
jgi:hypothetical protein